MEIDTDIVQGDIRFRPSDHNYTHIPTGKKLASVSEVIKTVYAAKSWDGVDPSVIENAQIRGKDVDRYMTQYFMDGRLRIENELEDVVIRVQAAHRIFEAEFPGMYVVPQRIVHSLDDGIAGTMDMWIDDHIAADLKCTYSAEKSWILQLGAYAEYSNAIRCGIIHVSPKVYKDGGVWMEYDVEACRAVWRKAVEWWKLTQGFHVPRKQKTSKSR